MINIFNKDVVNASNVLRNRYSESRYIPPLDNWPPYYSKDHTPLTIVHYIGTCTESETKSFAQKFKTPSGIATEDLDYNNIHHKIATINELFAPFDGTTLYPYTILIEGAPGIGKTTMCKEIAYQWAKRTILTKRKLLFLLFMGDPQLKNLKDVQSLVKYFFQNENLTKKVTTWLMITGGKYLTIILDGYDELSKESKPCFIIDEILSHDDLPNCGIVITSRPAASSNLHDTVHCRAEILGFTKEDQCSFIKNALKGQDNKIKELIVFLENNPSLNALCYTPLNMSILLYLTEDGINLLPKTQTILYQKFIIKTIIYFLKKNKNISMTAMSSLDEFPPPYNHIIKELSQFAFLALRKDQLVFTLAEVKAKCPNLTPANWYTLGLLKPAQYFKPQDTCNHQSVHFLHYSVQEYMAAYYIASLEANRLSLLLRETFWNPHYFNTWIMYVGITGGKHFTFTHFLSGNYFYMSSWFFNPKISNEILNNKIKCLYLLCCSAEVDSEQLSSVENMFQQQTIDFNNSQLSVNDIHVLAILLLQLPNKEWKKLNLSGCSINHKGCDSLYELVASKSLSCKIKIVDLSNNNFQWASLCKLCQVFKLWHTEKLVISIDALYDKATINLINDFNSELRKRFNTQCVNESTPSVNLSCTYIEKNKTMVVVYSQHPQRRVAVQKTVVDRFSQDSISCLQLSNCGLDHTTILRLKNITKSTFGVVAIQRINFSYRFDYNEICRKSTTLSYCCKKVYFCGSNMHSKGAYMIGIPSGIHNYNSLPRQIAIDYLTAVLCHNIQSKSSYLKDVKYTLSHIGYAYFVSLNLNYNNIDEEAADDIAVVLSHNAKLQKLRLRGNNLRAAGAIKIAKSLLNTLNLTVLDLAYNNISEEAADDIAAVLSHNTNLESFSLGGNHLGTVGIKKIAKALQSTSCLTYFGIGSNKIGKGAADDIATLLSHNTKLQQLYIGDNNLQALGIMKIAKGLQNTLSLIIINIQNNKINEKAADDIANVLSHNTELQKLYFRGNNLQAAGATKIAISLLNTLNLTVLDLSSNNITEEAADDIAVVLSHNTKLQQLYLANNKLQASGIMKIAKGLQNNSGLTVINLHGNNITEEAADDIAVLFSQNTNLESFSLGDNHLGTVGIKKIAKALQANSCVTFFGIASNNICKEAADDIAAVLFHNTKLQQLYMGDNNLQTSGIMKIAKGLQNTSGLITINIQNNNISEEAADDIAAALSHNIKLQQLYIGNNNLQASSIMKIAKGLQNTSSLIIINIQNNNIGEETAGDIAAVISQNAKLQKLYLRGSNLRATGAIKIAKSLLNTLNLTVLDLADNNISKEAAEDIATVLSHTTKLQQLYNR